MFLLVLAFVFAEICAMGILLSMQVICCCMKWINHEIVTGSLMFGFTGGDIACTVAGALGGLFPDMVEGRPPSEDATKMKTWRRIHRRLSHWFVPYAVMAIFALCAFVLPGSCRNVADRDIIDSLMKGNLGAVIPFVGWFAVGCIFHIGEDSLCGYVPAMNPHKRMGTRFFYVGSLKEYMLSALVAGTFLLTVMFF